MTLKQYRICRMTIVAILATSISLAINLENYYLPVVFVLTAMAGMYYCRKQLKTKEVLADERDYLVAGNSARYSITIFGVVGAISTFVLMAIAPDKNSTLYILSQFMAYSVCFLMIMNSILFKYLSRK